MQNRDKFFYSKFLDKLKSQIFYNDEKLVSKDTEEEEYDVYFIVNGVVKNMSTNRYFEKGMMINHNYAFLNYEKPLTNHVAFSKVVNTLKFTKS